MDNNNRDSSFELYSRHQISSDVPISNDTNNSSNRNTIDEYNPTSISIISGVRTIDPRPTSIPLKPNRKRSSTENGASVKANRTKDRSTLTSSFLRRKRVEYAGTTYLFLSSTIPKWNELFLCCSETI